MVRRFVLMALLALSGCSRAPEKAITVSVIGGPAKAQDPNRQMLDAPALVMTGALMQGLVQIDARGEIEPALAERWLVTDDGLSYIFRIRRTTWSDGRPVSAAEVAARLRESLAPGSNNPLRPLFWQVRQILPMTDSVLEIRLSDPQDNLLALLANPHMAIMRKGRGTGPYRLYRAYPSAKILRPIVPLTADANEELLKRAERRVRGEPAALAVARFAEGNAALVLGGNFANLALAQTAGTQGKTLRIDPNFGLFGLVPRRNDTAAGRAEVRRALAMAIDRQSLVDLFAVQGWGPMETLLPGPMGQFAQARPDWAGLALPERQARARDLIGSEAGQLQISLSLPDGPGARLLFARIASDWRRIGVTAVMARPGSLADFQLVDAVAPAMNALWFLRPFACTQPGPCSRAAENALAIARRASPEERLRLYAEADRAITDAQLFIPLARPLRWSLVAPQLTGFAENPTSNHPLNRLGSAAN